MHRLSYKPRVQESNTRSLCAYTNTHTHIHLSHAGSTCAAHACARVLITSAYRERARFLWRRVLSDYMVRVVVRAECVCAKHNLGRIHSESLPENGAHRMRVHLHAHACVIMRWVCVCVYANIPYMKFGERMTSVRAHLTHTQTHCGASLIVRARNVRACACVCVCSN